MTQRGDQAKTDVVNNTIAPKWGKQFQFNVDRNTSHIRFEVRDHDDTKTQFLGMLKLPLGTIGAPADPKRPFVADPVWYTLVARPETVRCLCIVLLLSFIVFTLFD
jgi:hypothetical protein